MGIIDRDIAIMVRRTNNSDDDIFREFNVDHRPTKEAMSVYFPAALLLAAVPLYLYHSIFSVDLFSNIFLFVVVTVFSAAIISLAYHNVAYWLKCRLNPQRASVITTASVKGATNKKEAMGYRRKKQSQVTDRESMAFSILYNNALFLLLVIILGNFFFGSISGPYNYVLSVSFAAAALSFASSAAI